MTPQGRLCGAQRLCVMGFLGGKRLERKEEMKKIVNMLSVVPVLVFVVVLNGCGGLEASYTDDELAAEEVAGPESEGSIEEPEEPAAEPVVESDDTSECADLDGDGYCSPKDCNDSPDDANKDGLVDGYFIHKGAVELCDGVDNDCDGNTDEGLDAFHVYEDVDGDGYGAGEAMQVCSDEGYVYNASDCDDSDANIHPGADDESGDGVDSDCDDEVEVVEVEQFDLTIKISYRDAVHRVFSYQLYTDESFVGKWWDEGISFTDQLVFEGNFEDASSFLGLRFNVAEDEPATSWLCEGNGRTATLDQNATISITFLGEKYSAEDLTTWSDPNGQGCSALIKFE